MDEGYEILVVSNFTLYGKLKNGNKPDFHNSMKPEQARILYEFFVHNLQKVYKPEKV
jgi:D-tyrosyl-tRNA(Tyr) deacylase